MTNKTFIRIEEEDGYVFEGKVNAKLEDGYQLAGPVENIKKYNGEPLFVAFLVLKEKRFTP